LKILKTFLLTPRPRPFCQDQDSGSQDQNQDQDFTVCPRGASRPRLWSRGLHHCILHRMSNNSVNLSLIQTSREIGAEMISINLMNETSRPQIFAELTGQNRDYTFLFSETFTTLQLKIPKLFFVFQFPETRPT